MGRKRIVSDPITGCSIHWDAKNKGQKEVQRLYPTSEVLFLLGVAGTGKTLAAIGMAAAEIIAKTKERIVAIQPAVECGRSVGFLKGNLSEKLEPWGVPFRQNLAR